MGSARRMSGGSINRSIERGLDAAVLRAALSTTLLLEVVVILVVHDSHADVGRIDVAMAPEKESTEARLSDEVKDAVEDGLRVGRDDIATLAETPGNGVQNPQEGGQGPTVQEALGNLRAVAGGVATSFPDELVDDVEKSKASCARLAIACTKCLNGDLSYQL